MKKIRLSKHFIDRWKERVDENIKIKQISNLIYRKLMPKLRKGIKTYAVDNKVHYVFLLGRFNDRLTFVVLAPDNIGLWSGWTGVTVITNNEIDDINDYLNWLYERGE